MVKVNNQLIINYNIISTYFSMVNQESDLNHCLLIKCHITAIFTFIDISTESGYLALIALNVVYLTFNDLLKYHKIYNLRNLTINIKISKNAIFAPYKC